MQLSDMCDSRKVQNFDAIKSKFIIFHIKIKVNFLSLIFILYCQTCSSSIRMQDSI